MVCGGGGDGGSRIINSAIVKRFLHDYGGDLGRIIESVRNTDGRTSLHLTIEKDSIDVVKHLISHNAEVHILDENGHPRLCSTSVNTVARTTLCLAKLAYGP